MVSTDPENHPSPTVEKDHYDQHENDPNDRSYRQFLSRLSTPVNARLKPKSNGLDFGCGPGPTLSKMFVEAGHSMQVYDPYYAPNPSTLKGTYDFITLSEVIEHLQQPRLELMTLWKLLRPNGLLGIMTKRVTTKAAFQN